MSISIPLIHEFGVVVLTLFVLGMCGGWLLLPFRAKHPYFWLAAPQAGLLALAVSLSLAYNFRLTIARALMLSVACLSLATIVFCSKRVIRFVQTQHRLVAFGLVVALALSFVITRITHAAIIHSGGPAILLMDGTDQLGYSQMADWLREHPCTEMPELDINNPYTSWPSMEFEIDRRFGSFDLMSAASIFRGRSGAFTYDFVCAVAFAAGVLGLAGVFCAVPTSLIVTVIGLLTSMWFDFSRTGYLGKLICYPAGLLVIGLCIAQSNPLGRFRFPALGLLAIGASITHSSLSAACLLFMGGIGFVIVWMRLHFQWQKEQLHQFLTLGFLAFLVIATSGVLGVPLHHRDNYPDWGVPWNYVWTRLFELNSQPPQPQYNISPAWEPLFLAAALTLHGTAFALAVQKKCHAALALLSGSVLVISGMWLVNANAAAFQMLGMLYPMFLCALALMLNEPRPLGSWPRAIWMGTIATAVLSIALHLFHFGGAVDRYCRGLNTHNSEYSMADVQKVQELVGKEAVFVDVANPHLSLMILVDLGGKGMKIQWGATSWDSIISYRNWPLPVYTMPAKFRIVGLGAGAPPGFEEIFHTTQLSLLRRTAP